MSIRLLTSGSKPFQHTIQDDMESYFYVVLYCGILWIRQTNEIEERRTLINEFFGEYRAGGKGGNAKFRNKSDKFFIREFFFESDELNKWIDDVCGFLSDSTKWTLDALYEYWEGVVSQQLPQTDREDHSHEEDETEPTNLVMPATTSVRSLNRPSQTGTPKTAAATSSKRSYEDAGLEDKDQPDVQPDSGSESGKRTRVD